METKQTLRVGRVTETLLLALRALEHARGLYFNSFEAVGGETYAAEMADRAAPQFDAVRGLIDEELTRRAHLFALDPSQTDL